MGFADGLVGVVLDNRYRLDAVIGEGGMGSVFRAHHLAMDRRVAVKLLKPHLTTKPDQLERFVREARATMKVDSPHAVKVLDFGVTPHADYYMVLEYLDGRTVQRELEVDGPFTPVRAVHVVRQALQALGAAHAIGLVHRDLKPDNVLLMRQGDDPDYAKLLDFGVAKLMAGAAVGDRSALALTQQGTVFGTPEYMSPEQACGHPLDGRSDLYAMGATLYAMLTGCGLFDVIAPIEWLMAHVKTPAPHLATAKPALADLPGYAALDAVVQKCLAKKREDRYADVAALDAALADVERILRGEQPAPPVVAPPLPKSPSTGARRATPSHSTFVQMLDGADTAALFGRADTADPAPPPRSPRLMIGLGIAVVAMIVVAIVIAATRDHGSAHGPPPTPPHDRLSAIGYRPDAGAPIDAPPPPPIVDAAPPVDAPKRPPADSRQPTADSPPHPNPHLVAAEAAHRAGNRLRQLAEADLALRADPRSQRAKFLMGDALIGAGDSERGCKYLRAANHDPDATARARTAGCGP